MKRIYLVLLVFFVSLSVAQTSLAKQDKAEAASPILYQSIVYLYSDTKAPSEAQLKQQLKNFGRVESLPDPIVKPLVSFSVLDDFADTYTVPDQEYLRYSGRGLSRSQADDIQNAKQIVLVNIAFPKAEFLKNYKAVNESLYDIATRHKGLIWDYETRELYSPVMWKEKRLAPYEGGFPNVADHITIHAYNNEGDAGIRAISLGMTKFGLPDVLVNNFSWQISQPMGNLINLTSQSLLEGVSRGGDQTLKLNVSNVKNTTVRESLQDGMKDNAADELKISIGEGKQEEGDPNNALLEILFDKAEGKTLSERQDKTVSTLFGWEDSIAFVSHDDEILKASTNAKAKLAGLRKDFKAGLEPGEFILLKAPFKTKDDGNEWMWVEVLSWDKKTIKGLLKNEPYHVPDLRAGSEVVINQDDVFDYIRNHADGTSSGNETGKIMSRNQR